MSQHVSVGGEGMNKPSCNLAVPTERRTAVRRLVARALTTCLFAAWSVCGVASAAAATIYDEALAGDLPAMPISPHIDPSAEPAPNPSGMTIPDFVLPEGESKLRGTLAAPDTPQDTEDWFTFAVPADSTLTSLDWISSGSAPSRPFAPIAGELWRFSEGQHWLRLGNLAGVSDPTSFSFAPAKTADQPLGPVDDDVFGMRLNAADDWPYEVVFRIAQVPEPSSAVAILSGWLRPMRRGP